MLVRISEIEIHRNSLPAYKAILEEEAEASVIKGWSYIYSFNVSAERLYTNKDIGNLKLHIQAVDRKTV